MTYLFSLLLLINGLSTNPCFGNQSPIDDLTAKLNTIAEINTLGAVEAEKKAVKIEEEIKNKEGEIDSLKKQIEKINADENLTNPAKEAKEKEIDLLNRQIELLQKELDGDSKDPGLIKQLETQTKQMDVFRKEAEATCTKIAKLKEASELPNQIQGAVENLSNANAQLDQATSKLEVTRAELAKELNTDTKTVMNFPQYTDGKNQDPRVTEARREFLNASTAVDNAEANLNKLQTKADDIRNSAGALEARTEISEAVSKLVQGDVGGAITSFGNAGKAAEVAAAVSNAISPSTNGTEPKTYNPTFGGSSKLLEPTGTQASHQSLEKNLAGRTVDTAQVTGPVGIMRDTNGNLWAIQGQENYDNYLKTPGDRQKIFESGAVRPVLEKVVNGAPSLYVLGGTDKPSTLRQIPGSFMKAYDFGGVYWSPQTQGGFSGGFYRANNPSATSFTPARASITPATTSSGAGFVTIGASTQIVTSTGTCCSPLRINPTTCVLCRRP